MLSACLLCEVCTFPQECCEGCAFSPSHFLLSSSYCYCKFQQNIRTLDPCQPDDGVKLTKHTKENSGSNVCLCILAAAVTCTTSSVCSRRTVCGASLQILNSGGAATSVHPAKEERVGLLLNPREAVTRPWHRWEQKFREQNSTSAQGNISERAALAH